MIVLCISSPKYEIFCDLGITDNTSIQPGCVSPRLVSWSKIRPMDTFFPPRWRKNSNQGITVRKAVKFVVALKFVMAVKFVVAFQTSNSLFEVVMPTAIPDKSSNMELFYINEYGSGIYIFMSYSITFQQNCSLGTSSFKINTPRINSWPRFSSAVHDTNSFSHNCHGKS